MLKDMIYKLRTVSNLSQEQFAEIFDVSRQSVQKWESGVSQPELDKIIKIAQYFDVSLDELLLETSKRTLEIRNYSKRIVPKYENIQLWEFYPDFIEMEYQQCIEEGLDIEKYKNLFDAVAFLPKDEIKKRLGDILFDIIINAKKKDNYKYVEPSDLETVKALRCDDCKKTNVYDPEKHKEKVYGAWIGRICGCLLGTTIEGIRRNELVPFLKATKNYPMHRYITSTDIENEMTKDFTFKFRNHTAGDVVTYMPTDDDTNYLILAQKLIDNCGKDFTPKDVANGWITWQSKNAYCTAERVAYCNFINGYEPPESAIYKNPFREWIGAQIRGDYYGYINPGDPEMAAEMAWRDASISHVKNGIYGEMFVSAMLATAAVSDDIETIIRGGISQIPSTSRLYEAVSALLEDYKNGTSKEECFEKIYKKYDEHLEHDWCHTISNALIVVAALLYGNSDYGKSICMAVEAGFDTDCNGATVGSIIGMSKGMSSIPEYWYKPINDTLKTSITNSEWIKISDAVEKTMEHIKMMQS